MGRIRMQLGLLLGLAPLVAAQREAPGIFKRLAMAGEEILERAVSDFDKCSCRCCQATERKDQEVERSSYGSLLTHKCVHPYPATEKCPAECTASHRLEAAQTAAKGVLDYGRFCFHACTPTVMVNGGTCSTPEEAAALRAAAAGNAARNAAEAWHPADMKISEEPQLAAAPAPAPAPAPVKPVEEEKEVKKITWDLRNIRAQRARAERYAADARAAYAAEQVKLHTHEIKSTVKMLDRVKKSVSEDTKSFEPEVLKAKANASAAGDAAVETYNVFKKAKAQSRKVRAETRDLARTIIAEAAAGAAQAEAESFVRRMHQAEVANFRAQVANQASLPYAGGVTTGVQREAEYRKLAEDSDVTAREAEIQMDDAEKEAKRLEQSDRVLAGMRNREATALRHQAEDAQAAASRYRSLAKKAHAAALGWQEASAKNSEHVADMYDLSVAVIPTPPPLVGIPRPPAFR